MKRLILGATALALLLAGSASAQPYGHDRDQDRGPDRGAVHGGNDRAFDRDHGPDRGGFHHYGRGERLDRRYGDYAEVGDWRAHRLAPPRRGYHWVRHGNDYVLAAVATGLIASVITSSGY